MAKGLTEREYNDTFPRMDNDRHSPMLPQDGAPPAPSRDAIVVYQPDATLRLDVRVGNDTVWLTQEQMCQLFGRTQPVIARHIGNIFREGELDREVVHAKSAYTTRHGAIPGKTQTKEVGLYNLDVVISVGYRVKSLLYLVGASLKDLGRKCFAFATLSAGHIPALRAACGLRAQ